LLHGVFIHEFQLQVAVFCVTLQYTLAFKNAGYTVADSVDEYGEFFLNRRLLLPCRERYRLSSVSDQKMRWRMKVPGYLSLLLLGSLLFSVTATASELRGSFRGYQGAKIPNNTTIHVSCGSASLSTGLNPNGSYSIRGLPASSGCSYRVNFEDGAASKSISFNSGNGVVTINGSLRKHGSTILVIAN
jgi:hypothetical protein